ncbi:MAG: peptidylprolyl isomerase [Bacteroidota bacterium]|nr:peptidylprolyl isomerase [Bacteroidota bacterium]
MIKRSLSIILIFLYLQNLCPAQNPDEKILMTVGGREVQAGEFIRMYNKSLDPANKTDIDKYVDQFVEFKLKVADAINQGYDTTRAFREELKGYRNQLAQGYLTDPDIKEKLIQKAYQRSLQEVNASHILISCKPDASPEDTLKAYKKAIDVRERIIRGEPFDQVAKAVSDDRSVLTNGGNLGYFTVFQMITPFEEAAYTLKPGTVSMPVRTPFGYHIIKVINRRPSRGKILVAHIMKAAPPGSDEQTVKKAEEEINKIYEQLKNGASFKELASKYSDHKESAAAGGEMNWFGAGEIIPDFSEAAFSIRDTGEYTKPIRTPYGFHIIKLLGRKVPGTFEETKAYLESKINQSNLNSLGRKSFIARLKKEYNFRLNSAVYEWFVNHTDTLIIQGKSKYSRKELPPGNIYSYANQKLSSGEFAGYLEKRSNMVITKEPGYFIDTSIESILAEDMIKYEDSKLEQKYPDFRYLMNEFHDGILLFDISSKNVWNKVQDDSAGLQNYYQKNKNNFLSKRSIEGKTYILKKAQSGKKLAYFYRKYSRHGDPDIRLESKFNRNGDSLLTITEDKWFAGDDKEIDRINWTTGQHSFVKNGLPAILAIRKVNEPEPLPFSEVQADVISGYQDWLTAEWITELKKKFTVRIDPLVLQEVKKRLSNE